MNETIKQIYNLCLKGTNLPCGGHCTYPACNDEVTENGEYCMERILTKIKNICEKA